MDIYERRPDPRHNQIGSGSNEAARSINLAISSRGLRALSSVRVDHEQTMADLILGQAVPMKARMIHTKDLGDGVQQMSQAYGLNGEVSTPSRSWQACCAKSPPDTRISHPAFFPSVHQLRIPRLAQ